MKTIRTPLAVLLVASSAGIACGPSGSAPQVQPIEDQVVAVSEELVIRIDAADEDGDALSYSFKADVPEIRSRSTLTQLPIGAGEFRWTPMASDVGVWYFDFSVSDGDFTTTVTVEVDVRSAVGANSAPRFLQPISNGTTLDLSKNRCISLEVLIDDPDSIEVEVTQAEPLIEGAEYSPTSGLGGSWNWCPTPDQINASNRYTLSLSADDGDNPATVLRYLVVLRRPNKENCPGEPPVVVHSEVDQDTLANVDVTATITDDQGLKDSPIVFYSTSAPADPPNLSAMSLATMTKGAGDDWSATIPNPVAGLGQGAETELYYFILARDNDDQEGACDHEVLVPESASFQITVSNPGGSGELGLCELCVADAQCGSGPDDMCVRIGSAGDAYCLSECSGPSDCPSGYHCSEDPVESIDGNFARQCLPDGETCEVQCEDDAFEDNDTRAQAALKAPLALGTTSAKSCPLSMNDDDEDYYRLDVDEDAVVELTLDGTGATDLDLLLYDEDGVYVTGSSGMGSDEFLSICLNAGVYYVRIVANAIGENDYTLEYSSTPEVCDSPICSDDALEDNDSFEEATTVVFNPGTTPPSYVKPNQMICSLDEDWYVLSLFDGETLAVFADFVHADGDLDVAILASDGDEVLQAGVSTDDSELIFYELDDPGCTPSDPPCIFYVAVVGYDGAQNDYALTLEVSEP